MSGSRPAFSRLEAKRREQTPQALARIVVIGLFTALWWLLWLARIPMPVPFLLVLLAETAFFLLYLRVVSVLPTPRSIDWAQYGMLAAEIVFHTTIVYFLGGIAWLGAFAYVFGLIFANTFLDLRRGLIYTAGAGAAFSALILLVATGAVPHYTYLEQGALRYEDTRFVTTTLIAALGVFFSIYLWVNWVGRQLRHERDSAVRMQEELLRARGDLQRANQELEARVRTRTAELERANEALRGSEEKLRTVITNVPVILSSLNRDGVYTLLEGKGLDALGVDREGLIGHSAFDIFRDEPEVIAGVQRALQGEALTMLVPAGPRILEARMFPVVNDGTVDGIIAVATDVTEDRRVQQALRESEERLRTVVTNAQVVLFALDAGGVFTLSDGRGLQTLGLRPGEVVGRSVFDIYRDVPQILDNVRRALGGETFTGTVQVGKLAFETHYTPVYGSDGRVNGVIGIANDITERLQAQHALQESEERFRRLTENAADIIFRFRTNPERGFEYVSPAVESVLGYKPEDFYADPDLGGRIVHAEDRRLLQQMITQGDLQPMVFRWTAKNGAQVWLDSRLVAIRDDEQQLVAIEGVMRDVTERKRWEDRLRESEERFRKIFEEGPLGMAIVGLDGRFMQANPTLCSMLGYTEEQLTQKTVVEVGHPDDAESNAGLARDVFAGKVSSIHMERRCMTGDGRTIWARITASAIHSQDGAVSYVLSMVEDVTERKRWEDALRESEAKFRTMAETVAAAAFIFQGGRMRYVNPAAERITGYSRDEILQMNFWDIIHPDFREQVRRRGLARQRGEHLPGSYEVKLVRKDGAECWVHLTAGRIDYDGRPAVLGAAFDITERKRVEAELHEIASHDHLTGLLNRGAGFAAIEERIRAAAERNARLALLVLDLDRFKTINDRFGHEMGDIALRHFASLLKDLVDGRGVLCRLGGDEFEVVLDGASLDGALQFAGGLLESLRHSIAELPEEPLPRFTVSVGVACYPEDGTELDLLRRRADDAMYAAKAAGGDRCLAWRKLPSSRAA